MGWFSGCGPSSQEQQLANQEASLSSQLSSWASQRFGEQSAEFQQLNDAYNPIIAGGPNQNGMSEEELSALNTTAIDTTAANYENAARATAESLSGRGGDSGLQSGIDTGIKANVASQAAGTLSSEELGIANENAQIGRQNYWQAIGGKQALAGMENPSAFAGEATNANSVAFGEANQIQQQKSQEIGDIVGGVVGIGSAVATGGLSALAGNPIFKNMGQNQTGNFIGPGFTPQSAAVPGIPSIAPNVSSDWSIPG